jgi:hypothetical protein
MRSLSASSKRPTVRWWRSWRALLVFALVYVALFVLGELILDRYSADHGLPSAARTGLAVGVALACCHWFEEWRLKRLGRAGDSGSDRA